MPNQAYISGQYAGDQLEPWPLPGPYSLYDLALGPAIAGDYIFVGYRCRPGGGAPTIYDDVGNTWIPIYTASAVGFWYCVANTSWGGNQLHFGNRSYDQAARVVQVTNVQAAPNFATANGNGSTGSVSLAGKSSGAWPIGGSSTAVWAAFMAEFGGASGSVGLYVTMVNSAYLWCNPYVQPNLGWQDEFPSDFGFLEVYSYAPEYGVTVADVVTDICKRSGLLAGQIDVTLLNSTNLKPTDLVFGYLIDHPTPAATILKVLMKAYFFDACETNGKMTWVPRGLAAALTIPEADLGLLADMAKIEEQIAQEQDLPKQFTVTHNDPTLDYQQNKQLKGRNVRIIKTKQQTIMEIPMTMSADWARQVGEKALYLAWLERNSYKLNLWRASYLLLDPTDVIDFVYEANTFGMRIAENSIGQGRASALQGISEYADVLAPAETGAHVLRRTRNRLQVLAATVLFLFDIPLLRDLDSNAQNTGFYYAMSSPMLTWPGGILFDSSDGSTFAQESASNSQATYGIARTGLAAPRSPWTWDSVNTLTVDLIHGSFAGDTPLNVLNGSNALLVGDELIQFTTAVQNSDGSWTLSGLLRGRRGTEWACGSHVSNELVVMPTTGMERIQYPLATIGQLLYKKGVTLGQDPATVLAQNFTNSGADLKPYAPVQITGFRDAYENLTIAWIRRTRVGWMNLSQDPVPLSEDSEAYSIDVMNGSAVVRTLSANSPTVAYSAAQQTTDFGSPQSAVAVNVYQLSAQVGRGFAKAAMV